jgi:hypothetical protein
VLPGSAKVRCQHGSWEGDRRDPQEQQQVEDDKQIVAPINVGEQAVVIHPHDANEGEADEKRKVRRPLSQQLRRKLTAAGARNLDFEDEQGDRNREDSI